MHTPPQCRPIPRSGRDPAYGPRGGVVAATQPGVACNATGECWTQQGNSSNYVSPCLTDANGNVTIYTWKGSKADGSAPDAPTAANLTTRDCPPGRVGRERGCANPNSPAYPCP